MIIHSQCKIRKGVDHPVLWLVDIACMFTVLHILRRHQVHEEDHPSYPRAGVLLRNLFSTWLSRTLFSLLGFNSMLRLSIEIMSHYSK